MHFAKKLVECLGGTIWLDGTFASGVDGYPGTRFVIDLNSPAMDSHGSDPNLFQPWREEDSACPITDSKLPKELSVLFVDDDSVLRRLFTRAVRKVEPGWLVDESPDGETALYRVDQTPYDLIFMDQVSTVFLAREIPEIHLCCFAGSILTFPFTDSLVHDDHKRKNARDGGGPRHERKGREGQDQRTLRQSRQQASLP